MIDGRETPARGEIPRAGFTLIELLVVVAVIAMLVGLLVPALAHARASGRSIGCMSNQRQLVMAWRMYASDADDRAMPLAYTKPADTQGGPHIYWWGTNEAGAVDHSAGFITPYLDDALREQSVFECPCQAWGTYTPQGAAKAITSTYGYNGYYLCPPKTAGWSSFIGKQPWKRVSNIARPDAVLVFGDAMVAGATGVSNTALLDPPWLFFGGSWQKNLYPTTCFRHAGGSAIAPTADGAARAYRAEPGWFTHPDHRIGSIGTENDPRYVPDWARW